MQVIYLLLHHLFSSLALPWKYNTCVQKTLSESVRNCFAGCRFLTETPDNWFISQCYILLLNYFHFPVLQHQKNTNWENQLAYLCSFFTNFLVCYDVNCFELYAFFFLTFLLSDCTYYTALCNSQLTFVILFKNRNRLPRSWAMQLVNRLVAYQAENRLVLYFPSSQKSHLILHI